MIDEDCDPEVGYSADELRSFREMRQAKFVEFLFDFEDLLRRLFVEPVDGILNFIDLLDGLLDFLVCNKVRQMIA